MEELLKEILLELKEIKEKIHDVEYNTWMLEIHVKKILEEVEEND